MTRSARIKGVLIGLLIFIAGIWQLLAATGVLSRWATGPCTHGSQCEVACQKGAAESCRNVGLSYLRGEGVVRSLDQALVFLRAACKGGDPPGCAGLGGLLLDGNTEDAYEEARSSLDKACTAGDAMGCNNLAGIYEDGLGVPVDGTRARKLYETACDKGSGMGCSTLAKALAEDADEQTRARSAKLFERAKEILQRGCYEGSARACGQVGWFYERGLGTKLDLPQAVSMYKSGCDGNDGASCFNLALTRRQASSNDSTIGPLLERACSLGLAEACTMLKTDPVLERDPAVLHPAAPAPDPPKPAAR